MTHPLTVEDIRRAMDKIRSDSARQWEERCSRAEQAEVWRDSLPEHVRDSQVVHTMFILTVEGIPIHPKDADALRAELMRLIG